jgi:hypothetical protein
LENLGFIIISKIFVRYSDCGSIAVIHNSAKVWVAHTEYTISKNPVAGEQNTIWDCRYESDIPKKRKVFEFG